MRDIGGNKTELEVGMILYGYCGGAFGREGYRDKRIEAIGEDWIVVRYIDNGGLGFMSIKENRWPRSLNELMEYTTRRDE